MRLTPWTTLHTGLRRPKNPNAIHCPLIETTLNASAAPPPPESTHLLFTSRSAVNYFHKLGFYLEGQVIAIGEGTAEELFNHGKSIDYLSSVATAEGVVNLLAEMDLRGAHIYWPHAEKSRRVIPDFLQAAQIPFTETRLYRTDPVKLKPLIDFDRIDEIHFTSPSTINAYLHHFGFFPQGIVLSAIGSITQRALQSVENFIIRY